MKRAIALFALVILAMGIVVLAEEPGQMPIDYKFVSPLPVGKMQYFPNEPGAPEAEIDLMCDGSFEDNLSCWEHWPQDLPVIYYAPGTALHGVNVMIVGTEDGVEYQVMQCWEPGVFAGYRNFQLWSSYRIQNTQPSGWPPCAYSIGLFIEWVEEEQLWYRLTDNLWELTDYDETDEWVTIMTYLPGMERLDDNYVCLLIEGRSCIQSPWETKFWFDEFVLAVDHEPDYDNVIFGPIVSKNYQ